MISEAVSDTSIALVTPTFWKDLQRCELLAESIDKLVPGIPHYLIVDRRDRSKFLHLQHSQRRLIDSEEIVGRWFKQFPGKIGYWIGLRTPPVRGWIVQQILKIGAVDIVPERTLIFCDSDVAFLRRFDRTNLLVDGKIGLLDVGYMSDEHRHWTEIARQLLGVTSHNGDYRGHVGNMICWNRETIKEMRQRIETVAGTPWPIALGRTRDFSEYMLYGVFVREFLGYEKADHAPSAVPLVKGSWGNAMTSDSAISSFLKDIDDDTVAIMVHSKDPNAPELLRLHLRREWARVGIS